ncbi:MAG: hypothetical protein ACTSWL_02495 [Promethearchaeota archaeon]
MENPEKKLVSTRFEYEKYIAAGIFIWGYSFFLPILASYYYFKLLLQPNLTLFNNFIQIWTNPTAIEIILITPLFLIFLYVLRLFLVIIHTKIGMLYCNWRSPHKELIAAKGIGKQEAKALNYYHLRGVMLRLLKWSVGKSPFPWLMPWAFNFVGSNKTGKGTTMEDQFYCQEFLETGPNTYIGQGSQISSHLVEGKYGGITLKKVKFEDNVVIGAFNPVAPGAYFESHAESMVMSGTLKYQKLKGYRKYYGLPSSRIGIKRYMELLQIPNEMIPILKSTKNSAKQLREKNKEEN